MIHELRAALLGISSYRALMEEPLMGSVRRLLDALVKTGVRRHWRHTQMVVLPTAPGGKYGTRGSGFGTNCGIWSPLIPRRWARVCAILRWSPPPAGISRRLLCWPVWTATG